MLEEDGGTCDTTGVLAPVLPFLTASHPPCASWLFSFVSFSPPKASLATAPILPGPVFSLSLPTRSGLPFPGPAVQPPTVLPHDEDVPTLVLGWQEDLGYHDKDLALGRGVDIPDALHASWVVAWVVGGLDIASELTQLPTTLTICSQGQWTEQEREVRSVGKWVGEHEEL